MTTREMILMVHPCLRKLKKIHPDLQMYHQKKKRRKTREIGDLGGSIKETSNILGLRMKEAVVGLGKVFGHQEIYEKQMKLNEELVLLERFKVIELVGPRAARLNVFFSLPDEEKDIYA